MRVPEELAWAAGFFDGEGCFSLRNVARDLKRGQRKIAQKPRFSPRAAVSQQHPFVIHRFQTALGFGSVSEPSSCGKWTWQVGGIELVTKTYTLLEPYLSIVKLEQGARVLQGELSERQKVKYESLL